MRRKGRTCQDCGGRLTKRSYKGKTYKKLYHRDYSLKHCRFLAEEKAFKKRKQYWLSTEESGNAVCQNCKGWIIDGVTHITVEHMKYCEELLRTDIGGIIVA